MIAPDQVSAVLVTRGDVDLAPILASIDAAGIDDVLVYDNSKRGIDLQVYGRYAAINMAKHETIYTQDDDCIAPVAELLAAYDGQELLVNVPAGEKPWVAWGAVFKVGAWRSALDGHRRGLGGREGSTIMGEMLRWPDVIFASLTPWVSVDLGHEDLPHAFAENRMYRMPDHYSSQEQVERRCVELGGTVRRA